jgi:hypothetical protein
MSLDLLHLQQSSCNKAAAPAAKQQRLQQKQELAGACNKKQAGAATQQQHLQHLQQRLQQKAGASY